MNASYRYVLVVCVAALSLFALDAPAVGQTVDLFTTVQNVDSGTPSSTVNGGVTVIGTFRDAIYSIGGGGGSSSSLSITGGTYTYTRNASDGSIISVDWDGNNDAITFDPVGLGGMDLTTGGANGFSFTAVTVNSATMDFNLLVHSSGSDASSVTVSTSTTGAKTVCYSDFSVIAGAGANFANVGAIQLVTFGNNAQDWEIGAITSGVVGGCSLPVELGDFAATERDGTVSLAWTTLSETNSLGFGVEHKRLANGESDWREVGFVAAAGSSTAARNYAFTADGLDVGRHAFRLRTVDIDGTFDYSETIEVAIESPESFALGSAYPNPFNPTTSFTLAVKRSQMVKIGVYDLLGRNVRNVYSGPVEAGQTRTVTVSGEGLTTGLYVIRAAGEFQTGSTPILLVK